MSLSDDQVLQWESSPEEINSKQYGYNTYWQEKNSHAMIFFFYEAAIINTWPHLETFDAQEHIKDRLLQLQNSKQRVP